MTDASDIVGTDIDFSKYPFLESMGTRIARRLDTSLESMTEILVDLVGETTGEALDVMLPAAMVHDYNLILAWLDEVAEKAVVGSPSTRLTAEGLLVVSALKTLITQYRDRYAALIPEPLRDQG